MATDYNRLLLALNFTDQNNCVFIQEHGLADSNFVITHLIKQILAEPTNKICLVILHNTIGHYYNVGKKLGYNLVANVRKGAVKVIEPMTSIYQNIVENKMIDKNPLLDLDSKIKSNIKELQADGGKVYLIIDDLSHLYDLGADIKMVFRFINGLNREAFEKKFNLIVNAHVNEEFEDKPCIGMRYFSDLIIDVTPLKTGRSQDVSGVITVTTKNDSKTISHYKAHDSKVCCFNPGDSIFK